MTQTEQNEALEKAPDKYSRRIAQHDIMVSLSASAVTDEDEKSAEGKTIWRMSDEALQEKLSDFDVDEVKRVLNMILDDSSVKKKVRRHAVSRITQNQPHPVNNFLEFRKHDQKIKERDHGDAFIAISVFFFTMLLMLWSGILSYDSESPVNIAFSMVFFMFFIVSSYLLLDTLIPSSLKNKKANNKIYGQREHLSLAEMEEKRNQEKAERIKRRQETCRKELEYLESLGSVPTTVSLESAKEDYKQAISRIAGYETDLEKALTYPAFNDINIPDVQRMVKQMRICRNKIGVLDYSNVNEFSNQVSELWVRIQTAEETAKRIALGDLNESEIKDIEIAKNLLAHASDASAYSEEVRAHFYEKLKSVVERLNTRKTIVNNVTVSQIENQAMRLLTQGKHESVYDK